MIRGLHVANLACQGLPKTIVDRAWDVQVRLCQRYRKLVARGKSANIAVVAIARELVGFIWDIARLAMSPTSSANAVRA
ncbi:hypothetical protein WT05_07265 [Burkholderia stagnalis]|nr:hypothetical protein WT05_07265 [Burkholderia stagnalis]